MTPSNVLPVVTKRQSAMSSLRASATIIVLRVPARLSAVRAWYHRASALSVPDTVPGKRVTDAGARTEGRGQPSNIRGWEPYAGKLHVRFWGSEASCHSSGCKSRQHKESSPCCSDTQRQGG